MRRLSSLFTPHNPSVLSTALVLVVLALPLSHVAAHKGSEECVSHLIARDNPPQFVSIGEFQDHGLSPSARHLLAADEKDTGLRGGGDPNKFHIRVIPLFEENQDKEASCAEAGGKFVLDGGVDGDCGDLNTVRFQGLKCAGTCRAVDVVTEEKRKVIRKIMEDVEYRLNRHLTPIRHKNRQITLPPKQAAGNCARSFFNLTGERIEDEDFVFFVTARPTWGTVAAWALPCAMDQASGRPISGHLNFGPANVNVDPAKYEKQLATGLHEALHALGMEQTVLGFMASPETPTKRRARDEIFANVTLTKGREGPKEVRYIITPKVKEFVQKHFGCDDVIGAELEDYFGTAGAHWEKRIFSDEIMTGRPTFGMKKALSGLTLSLFEDTGWYTVDYSGADTMHWGKGAGCAMLDDPCPTAAGYFCEQRGAYSCFPGEERYRTVCNVQEHRKEQLQQTGEKAKGLPPQYTYNEIFGSRGTLLNIAGSDEFADYCPLFIPVDGVYCGELKGTQGRTGIWFLLLMAGVLWYLNRLNKRKDMRGSGGQSLGGSSSRSGYSAVPTSSGGIVDKLRHWWYGGHRLR